MEKKYRVHIDIGSYGFTTENISESELKRRLAVIGCSYKPDMGQPVIDDIGEQQIDILLHGEKKDPFEEFLEKCPLNQWSPDSRRMLAKWIWDEIEKRGKP